MFSKKSTHAHIQTLKINNFSRPATKTYAHVRAGAIFRALALRGLPAIPRTTGAAPDLAASPGISTGPPPRGFPVAEPGDHAVPARPLPPPGRVAAELPRRRPVLVPVAHPAGHRGAAVHVGSHAPRRGSCPPTYRYAYARSSPRAAGRPPPELEGRAGIGGGEAVAAESHKRLVG